MTRLGGTVMLPGGERLTWSVADGSRGRRWREVVVRDGAVARALLLETDPDGRWSRLEMATAHGLLTLHPEPDDATVHGNVVAHDGVRHLTFAWSRDHALVVEGSPASMGAVRQWRAPGEGSLDVLRIDDDLRPVMGRLDRRALTVELDGDGLVLADGGQVWPLERDDGPARGQDVDAQGTGGRGSS